MCDVTLAQLNKDDDDDDVNHMDHQVQSQTPLQ